MEAVGRELVEMVREGTDLAYEDCKITVAALVGRLETALGLPQLGPLTEALDGDLLDVEGCGDAERLSEVHAFISRARDDSQERSWALHEDSLALRDAFRLLGELWTKADPRVPLHLLRCAGFQPFLDLVLLHQMEIRGPMRAELVSVMRIGLGLGPEVVDFALTTVLGPELGRELVEGRPAQPLPLLKLLSRLFSTAAAPPITHYEVLGVDFVGALLDAGESEEEEVSVAAHEALMAFALHFPAGDPDVLVLRALEERGRGRQRLSENLASLLNQGGDPVWPFGTAHKAPYASSVVEFLVRLCRLAGLAEEVMYSADAGVLVAVLLRQATDAGPSPRRSALLRLVAALKSATDWINRDRLQDLAQHLQRQENLPEDDREVLKELL